MGLIPGSRVEGSRGGCQLLVGITVHEINNTQCRVDVDIYLQVKYNINEYAPKNTLYWSFGNGVSGNQYDTPFKFGTTSGTGWSPTLSRQYVRTVSATYGRNSGSYGSSIYVSLGPLFEAVTAGQTPTVTAQFIIPAIPVTKPSLSNLRNNNPYQGSTYYCSSGNTVSVAFDKSTGNGAPTAIYWGLSAGAVTNNAGNVNALDIAGRSPGTATTIYIRPYNAWGYGDTVSITLATLATPVLGGIVNDNKYANNNGISASETAIWASCARTGGNTMTRWAWKLTGYNGGNWNYVENGGPPDINGAAGGYSGQTRLLTFQAYNPAGWGNQVSLYIRQRWDVPNISLYHTHTTQSGLNAVTVSWSCTDNKDIGRIYYKLSTMSSYWNIATSGKSGTFTIYNLNPSTNYTVQAYGTSTATYDSLNSPLAAIATTTDDISVVSNTPNFIFGTPAVVSITNDSGNRTDLDFYTYDGTKISSRTNVTASTSEVFTQEELDTIYRRYTNSNSIGFYVIAITHGNVNGARTYTSRKDGTMTLTGIAKTAWYNNDPNPRRGEVYFNLNGQIRRGVLWYNNGSGPRRGT